MEEGRILRPEEAAAAGRNLHRWEAVAARRTHHRWVGAAVAGCPRPPGVVEAEGSLHPKAAVVAAAGPT